jgi:hypothetical protein
MMQIPGYTQIFRRNASDNVKSSSFLQSGEGIHACSFLKKYLKMLN